MKGIIRWVVVYVIGSKRSGFSTCRLRRFSCLALFFLGSALVLSCRQQADRSGSELPTTGFAVVEAFAPAYERFGPRLLGEPISGACDVAGGGVVQYFQRMRLESPGDGQGIQFYPLGEWAHAGVPEAAEPVEETAPDYGRQRLFAGTGYTVRDEFLDFYEENDGDQLLGPPISSQLDEGGLRVQYFRNGRLEWHPGAPAEGRVRVGSLGQAHYAQAAHDVTCDLQARPLEVTAARDVVLRASAAAPILYRGEKQTVFVAATTPGGVPVRGVAVAVVVDGPGGEFTVTLGRTDEAGRVQGPVELQQFEPGQKIELTVVAHASDETEIGRTALSFETWW